ncbi:hypothetical protein M673_03835 [Aureimonas sp. AU20]|nr:hypothetical protein M673_03835 [Aureimonas sp. AU20]
MMNLHVVSLCDQADGWKFDLGSFGMSDVNSLRGIDLNLLVVLQALLTEQHVSRAAARLNMSQPAVSHALGRLRELFEDPLLIRQGGRLTLSAKARQLGPPLAQAIRHIADVVGPGTFDPASERMTFRLAMSDYGSSVVLPPLIRAMRRLAPNVSLSVTQAGREAMLRQVLEGEIDLAFGVFPSQPDRIEHEELFTESFLCLSDAGHASAAAIWDLDAYLARPHILVATPGEGTTEIDAALLSIGVTRDIAMVLPHWSAAPRLVHGTDLLLTIASRALGTVENLSGITVFEPPFPIATFSFKQVWHERKNADQAHRWMRNLVQECC